MNNSKCEIIGNRQRNGWSWWSKMDRGEKFEGKWKWPCRSNEDLTAINKKETSKWTCFFKKVLPCLKAWVADMSLFRPCSLHVSQKMLADLNWVGVLWPTCWNVFEFFVESSSFVLGDAWRTLYAIFSVVGMSLWQNSIEISSPRCCEEMAKLALVRSTHCQSNRFQWWWEMVVVVHTQCFQWWWEVVAVFHIWCSQWWPWKCSMIGGS